jgi:hypothetical protein
MTTITAGHRTYNLRPESYWHLTSAHVGFVLNNAYLGHGICWSISAVRRSPEMGGAGTTYGALMNVDKENAWERVRETVDKNLPTRQHAFFLFDDKAMAGRSCQTWFPGEDRLLLDARIDVNALIHRGDSRWPNCHQSQWNANAMRYWLGEMSADSLPEIVVDGAVYFPGWKDPPFGIGAGFPRA